MKRIGLALSLLIALTLSAGAAWAWDQPVVHSGFRPNNAVGVVDPTHPFFHHQHFHFSQPVVHSGFIAAPVVVVPARAPVWVSGFWQWTGWQWVWVPGRWAWGGW